MWDILIGNTEYENKMLPAEKAELYFNSFNWLSFAIFGLLPTENL
jgi:hypothetical protein